MATVFVDFICDFGGGGGGESFILGGSSEFIDELSSIIFLAERSHHEYCFSSNPGFDLLESIEFCGSGEETIAAFVA